MATLFKGEFLKDYAVIKSKFDGIKAFIFDWDGVFNSGEKTESGCSYFNEVDSMGINLLRFNYFLRVSSQCKIAVITGENNLSSFQFAEREHFHAIYYIAKNKRKALEHFCKEHALQPDEICFVFDDVLDLEVASMVGLRMMIGRSGVPLLYELVRKHGYADYITYQSGGNYAIREVTELLMDASGRYEETVLSRARFEPVYQQYFNDRNQIQTEKIGPEISQALS